MKALQQGVVKITCNSRTLADPRLQCHLKLMMHLPQTPLVGRPQQSQDGDCAEGAKPIGLPVRRGHRKVEERALFVPHSAVVRGFDAESVMVRREIRVLNLAFVDHLAPVAVLPFKLVLEMNLLRRYQAQSRVVNLQIASTRRQTQIGTCRARQVLPINLVISDDLLDVYRRRELV